MAQPKYTIYKYVRLKDGSWRYYRAALYANHTIKADVVIVERKEEKHPEGNYYLSCAGQWIPAGPDALKAQRQRHALLSGNSLEYERHSGRQMRRDRNTVFGALAQLPKASAKPATRRRKRSKSSRALRRCNERGLT